VATTTQKEEEAMRIRSLPVIALFFAPLPVLLASSAQAQESLTFEQATAAMDAAEAEGRRNQ
jgi:hypothetical protein